MLGIKQIKSLQQRKNRIAYGMFIAEGIKTVSDIMDLGSKPEILYYIDGPNIPLKIKEQGEPVDQSLIERISCLKTPPPVFAVFKNFKENNTKIDQRIFSEMIKDHIIFLDNISDPGNFGTIIRTADWFGFKNIVCSEDTVEMYNPKVVQSTMGSIANVNIYYVKSKDFLSLAKSCNTKIYGTFLNGKNIREDRFDENSVFIIGNEANGISKEVEDFVSDRIFIPDNNPSKISESLNAGVAFSILCYRLR
ncbi:MAG: RNA methyltransferase [Bacteroidales bacterium]|jgi:TrmH family RNA methyltransferase|nr:RNA methyltransferase [Bacteroidales bacterium]